jgi:hypothetical protein
MKDAAYCRAMESLYRQSAVFRPLDSWRLLAEAEMWHHRALEEITPHSLDGDSPTDAVARIASASTEAEDLTQAAVASLSLGQRCGRIKPDSKSVSFTGENGRTVCPDSAMVPPSIGFTRQEWSS